jgi:hypothetical protein
MMTQCKNRNFSFNRSLHLSEDFRAAPLASDLPPAPLKAGRRDRAAQLYTCLGFLLIEGTVVDVQEELDCRHTTWYLLDLKSDLKFGSLPSGLLIRCPGGEVRIVIESQLYALDEQLQVVKGEEA